MSLEEQKQRRDLKAAVMADDFDRVDELLAANVVDPFEYNPGRPFLPLSREEKSVFQVAAEKGNVNMLARLAAAPGTEWVDRFLVSTNDIVRVPTNGRDSIRSLQRCDDFRKSWYVSFESLEILLLCGFEVRSLDFSNIMTGMDFGMCSPKILMLALAVANLNGESIDKDEVKLEDTLTTMQNYSGWHSCPTSNGRTLTHLEFAEVLLKAGADPNKVGFKSYGTALIAAVRQRNKAMVELFMQYGGDPYQSSQSWGGSPATAMELAAGNAEMIKNLTSNVERMGVDSESYIGSLRHDLTTGYRLAVKRRREILVVAAMRTTGTPLPIGFASNIVSSFVTADPGKALWG